MARVNVTSWLVVLLCCAVFVAIAGQSGITQTTATLSESRQQLKATSSGELVFFGGGQNATGPSARVDIYNVTSGIWTTATLSVPRALLAAASLGNLVFFAGGYGTTFSNQVDIYNTSDGSWSTATLSLARCTLAATSVGNIVLFGGGWGSNNVFNVVDIYNVTSNSWTTANLSQARSWIAATSVAERYVLFGGGDTGSAASNVVDIYDSWSGMWNTSTLIQSSSNLVAASLNDSAFFGGGDNINASQPFNTVDIFNVTSYTWTNTTMSRARAWLAAASVGDIVAFGGGTPDNGLTAFGDVDMYNVTSHMWFTVNLSQPRYYLAATSSTNKIFFGGGQNSSSSVPSNIVDIFDISLPSPSPPSIIPTSPTNTTIAATTQQFTFSPATFNTSSSVHNTSNNTNSVTVLLAGVLSAVAVLIVATIILLVVLIQKKRKNRKLKRERNTEMLSVDEKKETVVLSNVTNTVILDETNTSTLITYQSATETLREMTPGQIPLNELEIGNDIGEGTYGRVCVGKWKKYRVALKFCQNRGKMDEFMREANLMITLPPHPNVVRMYGVSIDGTQPIIVMEYCAGGSLDKLLYDKEQYISTEQKIRWVGEIAMGMSHLHKYNIVHRDLAARNILLSSPNHNNAHLKISDFGMSRVLQKDIEGKTLNRIGPIRWMAPESIEEQVYSKKSDVWMFGVLVYEIVAQREPHTDKDPNDVPILIRDEGLTPTIPSDCPPLLRQLMQMCWNRQPEQRPSFETICNMLEHSDRFVPET